MARIQIVDDEKIILLLLSKILQQMNYDVVAEASNGVEAVEKALEHKPDLILMDISMPGQFDGISAAEKINAAADIPIIFVTAYSKDMYKERLERVKYCSYIVKPIDMSQLQENIEKCLKRNC